jgi:hypothetical protein
VKRPVLRTIGSAEEFQRWYWLKEELYDFCRFKSLPTSGSKPDLAKRIVAHLSGSVPSPVIKAVRAGAMPTSFELGTVIGPGWRCSPILGGFLRLHCGKGFRFNAAMRHFIHTEVGSTLEQAVLRYKASVAIDAPKQEIIPQNEYNRHTREFYQVNPNATRAQALQSWWAKRNAKRP